MQTDKVTNSIPSRGSDGIIDWTITSPEEILVLPERATAWFCELEGSGVAQVKLWYRGHDRGSYALTPSLLRYQTPEETERQLFDLYAETVPADPGEQPHRAVSWETVFRMQHYNIPTRLLDWTLKPWVAVYFALAGNPVRPCIYILNPLRLNKQTAEGIVQVPDNLAYDFRQMFYPDGKSGKREGPLAVTPTLGALGTLRRRLPAQQGRFTVHGTNQEPLEWQSPDCLIRVQLDSAVWARARAALAEMNINPWTLFPDDEGLAQHFRNQVGLRPIPYDGATAARIKEYLENRRNEDRCTFLDNKSRETIHTKGIGYSNFNSAYIPRDKTTGIPPDQTTSALAGWLDAGPPFLFVIGEAGVGKTNFLLHYLFISQMRPNRPFLFFPLRFYGHEDHQTAPLHQGEGTLALHLYKLMFDDSPKDHQRDVARKMIASGAVVVVLDGLDELARVKSQESVESVMRELDSFIGDSPDARVIISCRDHIFKRLQGVGVLGRSDACKPFRLGRFSEQTIQDKLRDELDCDPQTLPSIATIPLFYDMVLRAKRHLPELISKTKDDPLRLEEAWFEVMLRESALHNEGSRAVGLDCSKRRAGDLRQIGQIAGIMLRNRSDILELRSLDKGLGELIVRLSQSPFVLFERQSDEAYCFSHQSLREFVLAWSVADEVKNGHMALLEESSAFDYEGGEFYASVQRLLDFDAHLIQKLETLLKPPDCGASGAPCEEERRWNHLVRNLVEMIGELMPSDDRLGRIAVRKVLQYLKRGMEERPYIKFKTKYNIVRCLERIHYSAPRDPYCKHILKFEWSYEGLDRNQFCAHAIRGFHVRRQRPGVLPPIVFRTNNPTAGDAKLGCAVTPEMKALEREVATDLMALIRQLSGQPELPNDAKFLAINCSLALIRWLPGKDELTGADLDGLEALLHARHVSKRMKQNFFYALFRRYGKDIPPKFREVFKGIAPLSWRKGKSWACAEAKAALAQLVPEDYEEVWRGDKIRAPKPDQALAQ